MIFSIAAVGITGRTVGKPPWWLGPSVDPAPIIVVILVAVITIAPFVLAIVRSRHTPTVGLMVSGLIAVIALFDISDSPGVAVVELAVAIAGALGSAALYAGLSPIAPVLHETTE
jgi:hypothetical protein